MYSDTYEQAVYLVCGGGLHFSGNLMQSYIRTCTIWCVAGVHFSGHLVQSYIRTCTIYCVVGPPILVETSCNHTFEYALFIVCWGPPF